MQEWIHFIPHFDGIWNDDEEEEKGEEEVMDEEEEEEEEEEEDELRKWTSMDTARLTKLMMTKGVTRKWKKLKERYFADVDITPNAMRKKYDHILDIRYWYDDDKTTYKGRQYQKIMNNMRKLK